MFIFTHQIINFNTLTRASITRWPKQSFVFLPKMFFWWLKYVWWWLFNGLACGIKHECLDISKNSVEMVTRLFLGWRSLWNKIFEYTCSKLLWTWSSNYIIHPLFTTKFINSIVFPKVCSLIKQIIDWFLFLMWIYVYIYI